MNKESLKKFGIALRVIGTFNSIVALLNIDGDQLDRWWRQDAALERVWAVDDWAELERTCWASKTAQCHRAHAQMLKTTAVN